MLSVSCRLPVRSVRRLLERNITKLVTHSSLLCSRKANCGKSPVPGIMGESEGSTADAAGKAVIIPLGCAM